MASMASTEPTRSMLGALTSATNSPQAVPVKASPIRAMTWADLLRVERACHGTLRLMIIRYSPFRYLFACAGAVGMSQACQTQTSMLAVLHCARFNGDAVHFPFNASFSASRGAGPGEVE